MKVYQVDLYICPAENQHFELAYNSKREIVKRVYKKGQWTNWSKI